MEFKSSYPGSPLTLEEENYRLSRNVDVDLQIYSE